jgi:hypothetical protein
MRCKHIGDYSVREEMFQQSVADLGLQQSKEGLQAKVLAGPLVLMGGY